MSSDCKVKTSAAPHVAPVCDALLRRVADGKYGENTQTITLMGNARVSPSGELEHGALFEVPGDMPLGQARDLMGPVLSGRVGYYPLKRRPANLDTARKVESAIAERELAARVDDYGEDHAAFDPSAPGGSLWVPELDNGASSDNFVSVSRSATDPNKYALFVHSNATPQAETVIGDMLAAKPDATVSDFVSSPVALRLDELSTLQNKAIAAHVATLLKIDDAMDISHHMNEKTSGDKYAAPMRYADAASMMVYGDARSGTDGTIRLSNKAFDLAATVGDSVVLVHSPYHGATVVGRPRDSPTHGCLRPTASKTSSAIAVHPLTRVDAPLGADETEEMMQRLHFADKNECTAAQIAARIGAVDPHATAFSAKQLDQAGLGAAQGLEAEKFKTLGAIVFP